MSTETPYQFVNMLLNLHDEQAVRELDNALRDVVQSVAITGKAGSINLKLQISEAENDRAGCIIKYKIDSKPAVVDPKPVFFFRNDDNTLTREFPMENQRRLPNS